MPAVTSARQFGFAFDVAGVESELRVVRFRGQEGLSELFHFEIDLVSNDNNLDFAAVLKGQATLSLHWEGRLRKFAGIVREFEQLDKGPNTVSYRAILVPKLWWLAISHQSR